MNSYNKANAKMLDNNFHNTPLIWYIGIAVLGIVVILTFVGVIYYMYKQEKGIFSYSRPKPKGYTGAATNGQQIQLTEEQKVQLKANVAAAKARLA